MRYITIQPIRYGYFLDPTRYLAWFERHADDLPTGARAFAGDPEHYAFMNRCMKDLELHSADLDLSRDDMGATLTFRGPGEGSEPRLSIRYRGLTGFTVRLDPDAHDDADGARVPTLTSGPPQQDPGDAGGPNGPRYLGLGPVQLDEILPSETGCTHEIRFIRGTIVVSCADLDAAWLFERSA